MTDIVFYFQVHQPYRLRRYTFFDIGRGHEYWDDDEQPPHPALASPKSATCR